MPCNFARSIALLCTCRLDVPKAPLLLGQLLGSAISQKSFDSEALEEVCEAIEDPEARRELFVHVLQAVQVLLGPSPCMHFIASMLHNTHHSNHIPRQYVALFIGDSFSMLFLFGKRGLWSSCRHL